MRRLCYGINEVYVTIFALFVTIRQFYAITFICVYNRRNLYLKGISVVTGKYFQIFRLQKQINPKNINFEKLGYVLKDSSINFSTQEAAIEYGIKCCKRSVCSENPFERGIGITDRRIRFKVDGTANEVPDMPFYPEVFIHSHPDTYAKGCTTAPSSGDYTTFIEHPEMEKMLSVNSNGEYYELTKIPGYDYSKIDPSATMGEFNICMDRTLFGHSAVPAWARECLEKCIALKDEETYFDKFYDCYAKYLISNMANVPKFLVDKTHEFWVKFGEKFGVKFRTNFSNFTNKQN